MLCSRVRPPWMCVTVCIAFALYLQSPNPRLNTSSSRMTLGSKKSSKSARVLGASIGSLPGQPLEPSLLLTESQELPIRTRMVSSKSQLSYGSVRGPKLSKAEARKKAVELRVQDVLLYGDTSSDDSESDRLVSEEIPL